MISGIFNEIDQLSYGLDAAWLRNEVIANNIANADVPGFQRSEVSFEDYYKAALDDEDSLPLRKTRAKHMDIGITTDLTAQVHTDSSGWRMDGNNVDVDKEMTDLATNVLYYQSLQAKVASEITQLQTAITG